MTTTMVIAVTVLFTLIGITLLGLMMEALDAALG